jgi:hypothetical protein
VAVDCRELFLNPFIPSALPCGTSTSALKLYDESIMLGASPLGVPVISPDQVNWVRPAERLGRGATTRAATVASSGNTWYFCASDQNRFFRSWSLAGYLAATSHTASDPW